jgi:hypothetical protein
VQLTDEPVMLTVDKLERIVDCRMVVRQYRVHGFSFHPCGTTGS